MIEIHICFWCFGPIIFRWKPPQVFHIGTGWYCWKGLTDEESSGEESLDEPRFFRIFHSTTPKAKRKERFDKAKQLYQRYLAKGDREPILRFVRYHLSAKSSDAVHDLLVHLASQRGKQRDELVRRIVKSKAWQRFVLQSVIAALKDRNSGMRRAAFRALERIGPEAERALAESRARGCR